MSDITPQEALEFLEQANYFPITPDNHAEINWKKYISQYAIRNIVYGLKKLSPYQICWFLECIILCRDESYHKDLVDVLKSHKLKNIHNLVYEHLVYTDDEGLPEIDKLSKDQILNLLHFLARFAVIDSKLYLHNELVKSLKDWVSVLKFVDLLRVLNIHSTLKFVYDQSIMLDEKVKENEELIAESMPLWNIEKELRELIYLYFLIQKPMLDQDQALLLLRTASEVPQQSNILSESVVQELLDQIDLDSLSIQDLLNNK